MNNVNTLSDKELLQKLIEADKKETCLTAEILLFLAETDKRKIYLQYGYSSLFSYCTEKLRYSESASL